ncbi:MAG: 4Fe-4S dicluster domain-containing protein [Chloroflexi bacterium]|nr:4Fe-4S dicluster domain-containing protein [Chloroflexota bacterium]
MTRLVLTLDSEKCVGCLLCELACTFRHKREGGTSGTRIRIRAEEKSLLRTAEFCQHCESPACVELCPMGAIAQDQETGQVGIDTDKCTGCGLCLDCPKGGLVIDPDSGLAANCDLCGGNPACVEFCPSGALHS